MVIKYPCGLWFLLMAALLISGCSSASTVPELVNDRSSEPAVNEVDLPPIEILVETILREVDGMVQIHLPGNTYLRGSTEEGVESGIDLCQQHYQPCNRWYYEREYPQHEVSLSSYLIDQSEVTNQQYQLCVEAGICSEPVECKKGEPTYQDPQKNDHPVVCVNWEEASNYCGWVGGRLPTEAEWEYAVQGGGSLTYPWGVDFIGTNVNYCDVNCDQAHADDSFDDGYKKTAPAGSFPAGNSWAGLEDLGGNVSEWVSDWYGDYSTEPLHNPAGPGSGTEKMIKGCSWYSPSVYCRGATRGSVDPGTRLDYLGFRCAESVSPVIDGVIEPGEWDQGELINFEDGSELYLLQSGEYLYLAVRAIPAQMIAGNVFLNEGDLITIHHTSAALGTATYQKENATWRRIEDFDWCCRSRIESDTASEARADFFDRDGWLGINSFLGNENELEYQIRLSDSVQSIAVNFLWADDPDRKQIWPFGLSDGVAAPAAGGLQETMDFIPESWFVMEELP